MFVFFFFMQKPAYEMRISDWSSDVCSSDLPLAVGPTKFMVDAALVLQLLDLRLVHVQNAIQRIGEGQPGFVLVFRSPLKSAVADGADRLEGLHPVVGIHLRQSGAIVGESSWLFGGGEGGHAALILAMAPSAMSLIAQRAFAIAVSF